MQGKVVHCKGSVRRVRGSAVEVGNPFVIGRDGGRDEVIAKYERWLDSQPQLLADLPSLAGLTLACWCSPLACHADVLAGVLTKLRLLGRRRVLRGVRVQLAR